MKPPAIAVAVVLASGCAVLGACSQRQHPVVEATVEPAASLVGQTPQQAAPAVVSPVPAANPAVDAATQPDPPPMRVMLADSALRRDALRAVLDQEVPPADPGRITWAAEASGAAFEARDYVRAEALLREIGAAMPDNAMVTANLSVSLGKQGRYLEALAEADRALTLPEVDAMHAHAVRASWLWHLGRREEGRAAFAAIPVPATTDDPYEMYQGCRACFAASSHDLPTLRESIGILKSLAGQSFDFVRGDVIFDQYRAESWFVDLVGETLSPDL